MVSENSPLFGGFFLPRNGRLILSRLFLVAVCWIVCQGHSHGVAQQAVSPDQDPRYYAVVWVQQAAEFRLLAEQTYRYALTQLVVGLKDPHWSADEVQLQRGEYQNLPAAVILDLDETVLDNSFYNARNIVDGKNFTSQAWNQWCLEEKAELIPGALDFIHAAEGLGVKIFYLTNREDVVKQATINNLNRLGLKADQQNVLTLNPEAGRGDDKLTRRSAVAENYRVVMLIGDSMSDLCSGMDPADAATRNQVAAEKSKFLGTRWIMLPNPVYGGWQRVLPAGKDALELKR